MEKTAELEKRDKELKKVSLYERLSGEVSVEKQKEEIKEKIRTAVAAGDFEEVSRLVKVIDNLSKQDSQQQREIGDLRIREVRRVLSSINSLIPEGGVDVVVCGVRWRARAESRSVRVDSGITIEKNKEVEKVSSKETITQKVERMSELNPHLHITDSAKKYPKAGKEWLIKNFGTTEV